LLVSITDRNYVPETKLMKLKFTVAAAAKQCYTDFYVLVESCKINRQARTLYLRTDLLSFYNHTVITLTLADSWEGGICPCPHPVWP